MAILIGLGSCETSDEEFPCSTPKDCAGFSLELGRCSSEVYCEDGRCAGDCVQSCEVVDPYFNPCEESGQICNEPKFSPEQGLWSCTVFPIRCDEVNDCPVFLPSADGAWTCTENVCQFPGFTYAQPDR